MVPSNILLDKVPAPRMGMGDLGVETPSSQQYRPLPNYFGPCSGFMTSNIAAKYRRKGSPSNGGLIHMWQEIFAIFDQQLATVSEVIQRNTNGTSHNVVAGVFE